LVILDFIISRIPPRSEAPRRPIARRQGAFSFPPPLRGRVGWGVAATTFAVGFLLLIARPAQADTPLKVEAHVAKGTYYNGQAIEVRVGVIASGERPKVIAPRVDGAEVALSSTDFQPIGATGIGDVVNETNLFITRYRVTPTRPGPLVIPPFLARLGDSSGSSTPIRLTIKPVPLEGRPASYLRGVGRLEAKAEVVPASVRVGQAFEYRIILKGAGARGSTQVPILPEFEGLKGLKFEPIGTDIIADPPLRTLRFRVRPTAPGDFTLPSVAVATFDPEMQRYVETRAPSVQVRVVDVPRFDPSTLATIPEETPSELRIGGWLGLIPAALVLGAWVLLAVVRRRTSARRWARVVARGLRSSQATDVAPRIASGLTTYLARSIGRAGGELTPVEAERGIAQAIGDPSLAHRSRQLIEHCDRARFGDASTDASLAEEALAFFEELATRRRQRGSGSDNHSD
jgi:hypothetical protein